ncbi:MarR family winged helix-turn-helix transcriptional regulator, partial [Acinetobacter baumannii]
LIERRAPPGGRRPLICLTAEGRALEARLLSFATDVNRAALRGIPPLDLAATCRTLEAMVDNFGRPPDVKSRKTS